MSQQLLIDYWQRVTTIMTVKIRQFSPITDAFENVIILSDPTRGWTQPVTNSVSHSNCWFIQIGASQVMVFDIGRTGLKKNWYFIQNVHMNFVLITGLHG